MTSIRPIRRRYRNQAIAQALFFMALLGAFLLGMMTSPRQVANSGDGQPFDPASWREGARRSFASPHRTAPQANGVRPGASMRGVMEELSVQ